ncbi:DeoR/GlpR family DNA-binding transcription regulator [Tessaracoccus terricola]
MTSSSNIRHLYAAQRHDRIVAEARAEGRVDVSGLAERLKVTPETVRRDLTLLERRGLVRRVHGGALPVTLTEHEPTVTERLGRSTAEKERIAMKAVQELPEEGVILLDAGTSTLALARVLPNRHGLSVVTNSVTIAATLMERANLTVHVLGGRIRGRTGAAVGSWAMKALADLAIDVVFLGANGFTLDRGFTTPDEVEADVKRAMVAAARRSIVLADATKAGQVHFQRFATPSDIELLITDERLDDETVDAFEDAGAEVLRA